MFQALEIGCTAPQQNNNCTFCPEILVSRIQQPPANDAHDFLYVYVVSFKLYHLKTSLEEHKVILKNPQHRGVHQQVEQVWLVRHVFSRLFLWTLVADTSNFVQFLLVFDWLVSRHLVQDWYGAVVEQECDQLLDSIIELPSSVVAYQ